MKETPIPFQDWKIRKIQELKDNEIMQTRRVIRPQPEYEDGHHYWWKGDWDTRGGPRAGVCTHGSPGNGEATWTLNEILEHCPYGKVGDRLGIKEDYKYIIQGDMVMTYYKFSINKNRAIYTPLNCLEEETRKKLIKGKQGVWKSKLLMFKFMSRIWSEITEIRVERVQEITERDIIKEGEPFTPCFPHRPTLRKNRYEWFSNLWDSINKKRGYGWDVNPYVWVISFRKAGEK